MKHSFYGIPIILLLLLLCSSCDNENSNSQKEKNVSLEFLPGTWVIKSYDTATQVGTGTHTTTTTLDGNFTVSLYDDMLFTLAGEGTMLAEGQFSIDIAQLKLEMKEYSLLPNAEPQGIDETLVDLITSHPLHIETLDAKSLYLSLKYSDNVTITAFLTSASTPGITGGNWLISYIDGYAPFTASEGTIIEYATNGTFSAIAPNTTTAVTGTYSYTPRTHTLLTVYNGDTLIYDAVCSEQSLRITPQENRDYAIYLTRQGNMQ